MIETMKIAEQSAKTHPKTSETVGKVNRDLVEEKEIGIMSEKLQERTENLNLRHCSYM